MVHRIFAKKRATPNKDYYDAIERAAGELDQPTVNDVIEIMRKRGNTEYSKAFGTKHERPFSRNVSQLHEVAHLSSRVGHALQQEESQYAFQSGLACGPGIAIADDEHITELHRDMKETEYKYVDIAEGWGEKKHDPSSKATRAVNFAAGVYLRCKIDLFIQQRMMDKGYEEQKNFCDEFESSRIPLVRKPHGLREWNDIGHCPYNLIKLSRDEWRAIEAVALGMVSPEQTFNPQRLGMVKEALTRTGLFYDRPASMAEREERRRIEQHTNEVNHRA